MNATIALRGIRAYGNHGVEPGERAEAQLLEIDLDVALDASAARASDELTDTLDYAALHARVVAIVAGRSFRLLEALGDALLAEVMREPRVAQARLTIAKPGRLDGATPSVTLVAQRDGCSSTWRA